MYTIEAGCDNQPMLVSKVMRNYGYMRGKEDLYYLVPEFCFITGLTETIK